ncbi:GPW/gp25 family protein [Salinigranum salinum]|uniref:GPW/gp25 family protein n=1 Tax=Salinigranum salinum TaxID=1364937 RepID=UPI0012604A4F|nr:GPW/gp25 family protein [Salinigranum salinum]
MQRDFLGTGWSFPVEPDATGDVELSSGEADVAESIWIVLGTAKGERTMRPDFGCGIHDYVFATVNTTTLNLIETSVREALIRWEPRIEVQNVEIRTDEIRTGKLLVDIDYRIRNSNTEANLVYPFYLEE